MNISLPTPPNVGRSQIQDIKFAGRKKGVTQKSLVDAFLMFRSLEDIRINP